MTMRELNRANKLADAHTANELAQMCIAEPDKKKSDVIAWAVYVRQRADRAAAGNPVPTCGYSGRKSNRR